MKKRFESDTRTTKAMFLFFYKLSSWPSTLTIVWQNSFFASEKSRSDGANRLRNSAIEETKAMFRWQKISRLCTTLAEFSVYKLYILLPPLPNENHQLRAGTKCEPSTSSGFKMRTVSFEILKGESRLISSAFFPSYFFPIFRLRGGIAPDRE